MLFPCTVMYSHIILFACTLELPHPFPSPSPGSLDRFAEGLSQEVQLEFCRSMNRILFDKTVSSQPGTYPFVTLPDPHVETVPKTGEPSYIIICTLVSLDSIVKG